MKHVVIEEGGRFLIGEDVEFVQSNVKELVSALLDHLSLEASQSVPTIVTGVRFTDTGTTITATAGWIYWQGELYRFEPPATPIAQTGLVNVKLYRTTNVVDELPYFDDPDTPKPIQVERLIALQSTNWVDTNVLPEDRITVSALTRLGASEWENLADGTVIENGPAPSLFDCPDGVFELRINRDKVEFYANLRMTGNVPGNAENLICILPEKYWPRRIQEFYVGNLRFIVAPGGNLRYRNTLGGPSNFNILINSSFNID